MKFLIAFLCCKALISNINKLMKFAIIVRRNLLKKHRRVKISNKALRPPAK
jgi:hypothetical protein